MPNAGCAQHLTALAQLDQSHALIRVYDDAGNVTQTHEDKGQFRGKAALVGNPDRPRRSVSARRAEQSELRHLSPPRPSR